MRVISPSFLIWQESGRRNEPSPRARGSKPLRFGPTTWPIGAPIAPYQPAETSLLYPRQARFFFSALGFSGAPFSLREQRLAPFGTRNGAFSHQPFPTQSVPTLPGPPTGPPRPPAPHAAHETTPSVDGQGQRQHASPRRRSAWGPRLGQGIRSRARKKEKTTHDASY